MPNTDDFIRRILAPSDPRRSDRGYCYEEPDGLDGSCVHVEGCPHAGRSWSGPNWNCVKKPKND